MNLSALCFFGVQMCTVPKLLSCQFFGMSADAALNVLSREAKRSAVFVNSPERDMDVWMLGIPVNDSRPFELGSQITFHSLHQIARVRFQIDTFAKFGRDDELE